MPLIDRRRDPPYLRFIVKPRTADNAAATPGYAGDSGRLGLARGPGGQRHPPGQDADFRPAMANRPARLSAHVRQKRRPAGRPDGQFGGRPSQYRRRPRGDAGPAAHRRSHQKRRDRARAGARGFHQEAQSERRHLPFAWPRLARWRARASGPRCGAGEDSHRRRRAGAGARVDRRPRHAPAIFRRGHQALDRGAAEISRDCHRVRTLLRHGSRQALGPRREGV